MGSKCLPFRRRILTSTVYPSLPSVDFASARSSVQKILPLLVLFTSASFYIFLLASPHNDASFLFFLLSRRQCSSPPQLNLDPRFIGACLVIRKHDNNPSPLSVSKTLGPPKATRLTDKYPNAYSELNGSVLVFPASTSLVLTGPCARDRRLRTSPVNLARSTATLFSLLGSLSVRASAMSSNPLA